jgi:hypothetical protein
MEGWSVVDGGVGSWEPDGGSQGGGIRAVEDGSSVYGFLASDAYLGDKSAFYGGSLTFDLKQDTDINQVDGNDIVLTGGGLTIAIDIGANPGTEWTQYSVGLGLGAGWKIGGIGGRVATAAEIQTVLASLERLWIRGEFVNGTAGDASNLDNVVMADQPPAEVTLQGARIASDFEIGTEGWSFIADVKEFRQVASGGNSGGYLEAVDYTTGQIWYFAASDAYLGNKQAFSGGTLSFDLKQSGTNSQIYNAADVQLVSGAMTLVVNLPDNPGTDWTPYAITFDTATDWRIGSLGGAVATQAEIDAVLADLQNLYIRGEYINGPDTGGLDTVRMTAVDANVRLLADGLSGALLSSHDSFAQAMAAAQNGNAILIEDGAGMPAGSYEVTRNNLTVVTDLGLRATLTLESARNLTLSGDNHLNVTGNGQDNRIFGSDGRNRLDGGGGGDDLRGGGARDILLGRAGADALDGGSGHDRMLGGGGNDTLLGQLGDDTLLGGAGRDLLDGGRGNDMLNGGGGKDRLLGGDGDDVLAGGRGNDVLNGQGGADRFEFAGAWGRDRVLGFEPGTDVLHLAPGGGEAASLAEFLAASQQVGGNLVYDMDGDGRNVIVLQGITAADLSEASFDFA